MIIERLKKPGRRRGGMGARAIHGDDSARWAPLSGPVLLLVLLAALMLAPVWAGSADGAPLRRMGQNPRGLAMGGTGVSYANDEMALYYNPAGLGSITNFWVELLPIAIEVSGDAVDLATEGDFGNFDAPADLIRDNIGKELEFRGFAYPHGVFNLDKGLTVGASYFQEVQVEMMFRNQATPEIEAYFRWDKGNVIGLSFPMKEGKFLGGIAVRNITRQKGEGTLSSAALAVAAAKGELDLEEELNIGEGSGTGYDLGLLWRLESFSTLRGQFGLAVTNVGGTDLGEAGEIPQEVSIGWAFQPRVTSLRLLFAFELRDVGFALSEDDSQGKRTHFGVEVGFIPLDDSTSLLTARAGSSGSSPSFGLEIALWHSFSLQYVVYHEEYGSVAGEDARQRRLIQINFIGL